MCGRGTQHFTWQEVHDGMDLIRPSTPQNLEPRYNITRFQTVQVVRPLEGGNELVPMLWEFVPFYWSKPLKEKKFSSFNARMESLAESRAFGPAWKRGQRCIVPFSGFYEWPRPKKKGQEPFYIRHADDPILPLAGLWSEWTDAESGESRLSFAIITGEANDLIREIPHHRSPVVIGHGEIDRYLQTDPDDALSMLGPPGDGVLSMYRVGNYVNAIRNEGPACIEPVEAAR